MHTLKRARNEPNVKGMSSMTFDKMTPEQHRMLSIKGGIMSGKKRWYTAETKKRVQEEFEKALIEDGLIEDLEEYRKWRERQKHKRKRKVVEKSDDEVIEKTDDEILEDLLKDNLEFLLKIEYGEFTEEI